MPSLTLEQFTTLAAKNREKSPTKTLAIPLGVRLLEDQLTPVLAYRRLVSADERTAPSFLLESVEGGQRQGRHSILSAHPTRQVIAQGHDVTTIDPDGATKNFTRDNPLHVPRELIENIEFIEPASDRASAGLPECFIGGWVGYAGYDTVRYSEPEKLASTPKDDRGLPDLHMAMHEQVVVFDHVEKLVHVVGLAMLAPGDEVEAVYKSTLAKLEEISDEIQTHSKPLSAGRVERERRMPVLKSNTTQHEYESAVERAQEYIRAGDIFQVVLGQRFERTSKADPFDVYRALRAVNPSPYMVYMQSPGCILVAASPEILCRVRKSETGELVVTNRPLAGTRRRGKDDAEDQRLEQELLADEKECAEHAMLVDLARNDVGQVASPGSIKCDPVMVVERYSHVMHISSTVTGVVREGLDAWDALHAALPVGTVSGAPKIRAMQIIDELEPVKRGPYGGGLGYIGLDGNMDIALALRTIVVPTKDWDPAATEHEWHYHVQAAAGVVLDSVPEAEFKETIAKAGALAQAIELADAAFVPSVAERSE
ncbi:MAG: anthranilate synthase component I [Phycisphaerales bacterium JB061]